jgi:hypothetical protein
VLQDGQRVPRDAVARGGVAVQQQHGQLDQGAVVRAGTEQPQELVPGEPAAGRRERGNQLVVAVVISGRSSWLTGSL